MANTYSQIYLQFVFAVKAREALIPQHKKEELQKYFTGLVKKRNSKMLAVNCMPDHCHLFVGFKPTLLISDFMKELKVETSLFMNQRGWTKKKFAWQEGYGVFSYSHSHLDSVIRYIHNQETHHKKKSFRTEYLQLLSKFEVPFEEKYVFEFFD